LSDSVETARPLHSARAGSAVQTTVRQTNGFALIDLIFVVGMIGLLASIAFPRMLHARQSAGAASAIGSLRTIGSAQLTFALTCGAGFYAPTLSVLGTAPPRTNEAFVSPNLGSADSVTRSGYLIRVDATAYPAAPPSCNGLGVGETAQAFKAGADALEADNPRHFAINANGQIFEHTASLFAVMPEVGEPAVGWLLK
jgi:type II secretory pathway pseudopilin PulG